MDILTLLHRSLTSYAGLFPESRQKDRAGSKVVISWAMGRKGGSITLKSASQQYKRINVRYCNHGLKFNSEAT
jgi:hypothetical protein